MTKPACEPDDGAKSRCASERMSCTTLKCACSRVLTAGDKPCSSCARSSTSVPMTGRSSSTMTHVNSLEMLEDMLLVRGEDAAVVLHLLRRRPRRQQRVRVGLRCDFLCTKANLVSLASRGVPSLSAHLASSKRRVGVDDELPSVLWQSRELRNKDRVAILLLVTGIESLLLLALCCARGAHGARRRCIKHRDDVAVWRERGAQARG